MTTTAPRRGLPATHPGEILREDVIPALGKSVAEIARLLHVSRQTLHAILRAEAPVTSAMALKLGKLCGNGPTLWLNLQRNYDLDRLSESMAAEIENIPTLQAAE
jgi:addiction module HigA family antidote